MQPQVLDRTTDGEVVEALEAMVGNPQQFADAIVEEAADPGRAQLAGLELGAAGRFCPVRNCNFAARSFSLQDALST